MATKNSQILATPPPLPWIGWTTVDSQDAASELARSVVEAGLAACAQVSAPIQSWYQWEGKLEQATEYRITLKFHPSQRLALQQWLRRHHPYDTPQWVAVESKDALPEYTQWIVGQG